MNTKLPVSYLKELDSVICSRCKDQSAIVRARKDGFCAECFIRFVRGKQRKQMMDEKYKVKYGSSAERLGTQRVLLAFSGGVSSIVLLDVMASLLMEQDEAHGHRQGFELILLCLTDDDSLTALEIDNSIQKAISRYPSISISYKVASLDSFVMDEQIMNHISFDEQFSRISMQEKQQEKVSMASLLSQCPTKTAAEDLRTIVSEELILRTAYVENCLTILYSHCMTRLANEVIALTVKGRGSSIHESISNRTVEFRGRSIDIVFPLRDIMFTEVQVYAEISSLKQYVLDTTQQESSIKRNWTIRDLVTDYFHQLDATGYASTASTVIKTGEKLGAPTDSMNTAVCEACGHQIYLNLQKWLKRITVNEAAPISGEQELANYNRYMDSISAHDETEPLPSDVSIELCFGCIVTMGRTTKTEKFVWPARPKASDSITVDYIDTTAQERSKILKEFILSEPEE